MRKITPPKLVTVAVFTTISIIFWIFFSVYNILTSDAEIDIDPRLLEPIDSNINTQVLDQLPSKRFYETSNTQSFNIFDEDNISDEVDDQEGAEIAITETEEEDEEVEAETETDTEPVPESTETTTP